MKTNELTKCDFCGQEYPANTLNELVGVDGAVLCDDCKDNTYICSQCGTRFDVMQDGLITEDDIAVCGDCVEACSFCGNACHPGDMISGLCSTCREHTGLCDRCLERYSSDELIWFEYYEESYCEDCAGESSPCRVCGEHYFAGDMHDETTCNNCVENSIIQDYDYRPDFTYYRLPTEEKSNNLAFLGIELEVESQIDHEQRDNSRSICDDAAEKVISDYLYCKNDGSLEDGFEVVSHPMTFEYIREHGRAIWDRTLNLNKLGFRSYNTTTCGMHVHIAKKAFSSLHLYKFLKLFYENQKFILAISQRRLENLTRWSGFGENEQPDLSLIQKAKIKSAYIRYSAVNLTNRSTVEVRIFRGTLHEDSFWKNIEFVAAAFEYSRTVAIKNVGVYTFCKYVEKHAQRFPNLLSFMKEKAICV